jgi:hypothetical protein|tara:strand:- start:2319 stop:2480 length:162 start_codon:yes stop_codon:yes gene_type:complete
MNFTQSVNGRVLADDYRLVNLIMVHEINVAPSSVQIIEGGAATNSIGNDRTRS